MAAGAWISIPIGPVPITLQTFFIVLAGFFLGSAKAFLAAALYVLAGIAGFPVFAGGLSGPAIILGPTAGYALSFPLGALISGLAKGSPKGNPDPEYLIRPVLPYVLWGSLGTLMILLGGSAGLMINLKLGLWKALALNIPFLPGDVVKLLAATLAARSYFRRKAGLSRSLGAPSGPEA
jgi:biotin transport system substrate-specific component